MTHPIRHDPHILDWKITEPAGLLDGRPRVALIAFTGIRLLDDAGRDDPVAAALARDLFQHSAEFGRSDITEVHLLRVAA